MKIRSCRTIDDYHQARSMFREYADQISTDLCFQNFNEELKIVEQMYSPPAGELLFAEDLSGNKLGCVAIRKVNETTCELKRMYVRPEFRNQGIGKHLLDSALKIAPELGYRKIKLDTLPTMKEAIQIYISRGFSEISSNLLNPVKGTIYMERSLEGFDVTST